MEDLKKSILDTLNERISSPLIGGFIISWLLWNYKTVFMLLSTNDVEYKFDYIENILYSTWIDCFLHGLLLPLLTALIFIFIFPYPEKFIYKYWHKRKQELKELKQEIDNKARLTKEQSRKLLESFIMKETEYYENLEKKEDEIKRLKEIISNKNNMPVVGDGSAAMQDGGKTNFFDNVVSNKEKNDYILVEKSNDDLNDEEKKIIETIVKNNGIIRGVDLIEKSSFPRIKAEYLIEDLRNKGYIDTGAYTLKHKDNSTSLTQKGKKAAIDERYV